MKTNCFKCKGHGFIGSGGCVTCSGTGSIDTDLVCRCSQPATRYAGDTIVCASEICYNKAIAVAIDRTAKNDTDTLEEFYTKSLNPVYLN